MINLLTSIKKTFSRELVGHIASRLGEPETGIQRALSGIVPVVLSGLISKARAGESRTVYRLSLEAYRGLNSSLDSVTGLLGLLGSGITPGSSLGQGEALMALLFANPVSVLAGPIGAYAAIRPESTVLLLSFAGAVLPALVGQYAIRQKLRPANVAAGLVGLQSRVRSMLPRDLRGLLAVLWLEGPGAPTSQLASISCRVAASWRQRVEWLTRARIPWCQMMAASAALVLMAWLLLRCAGVPTPRMAAAAGGANVAGAPVALSVAGQPAERK